MTAEKMRSIFIMVNLPKIDMIPVLAIAALDRARHGDTRLPDLINTKEVIIHGG